MYQQFTTSEQKFRQSLRSDGKSGSKPLKKAGELSEITKFLSKLVHDLEINGNGLEIAQKLVNGQNRLVRKHISFFVYIPDPKTHIGIRILKDFSIWIIILVVFHSQCNRLNKLDDFVYMNIEEHMTKHLENDFGAQEIQIVVNKILDRLKTLVPKDEKAIQTGGSKEKHFIDQEIQYPSCEKIKSPIDELIPDQTKEEISQEIPQPPNVIQVQDVEEHKLKQFNDQGIQFPTDKKAFLQNIIEEGSQERELPQSYKKMLIYTEQNFQQEKENFESPIRSQRKLESNLKPQSKLLSRSKLRVQFSDNKENFNDNVIKEEKSLKSEFDQIIDQQVKEVEDYWNSGKEKGTTLTEKIFSLLQFRYRSEQKLTHQDNITIHEGFESKQLSNSIVANVESIILEDIKGNHLHSIVKLSTNNPEELIENGLYAMVEMNKTCKKDKHLDDWITYQNFVNFNFQQPLKILIPFNQYKL